MRFRHSYLFAVRDYVAGFCRTEICEIFSLFSSSINCVAPIILDSEISTYRSNSTKYAVSHNCSHVVQKLQRCCPGIHASCNDKFNRRVITGFQLENEQWYQPQFHQNTEKLLIKFIKRVVFFRVATGQL